LNADLFDADLDRMNQTIKGGGLPDPGAFGGVDKHKFLASMAIASLNGCALDGFDTLGTTARDEGHREAAMKVALENQLKDPSQPLIVTTGSHHFPELHRHLADKCRLVSFYMASKQASTASDSRRRLNESLDLADVKHFRRGKETDAQPLDIVRMANEVGLDVPTSDEMPRRRENRTVDLDNYFG
jgi:hypothetical protein